MEVTVKKWGNSAAIRIPAAILRAADIKLDESVDVREERGRILIEPKRKDSYDLNELVGAITSANQHEAIETGPAAGREVW